MKPVSNASGTPVWCGSTARPYAFTSPAGDRQFSLLLVVGDADVSAEEQDELSEAFVRQGCRYAVCFGHDSSSWDDSIDMVSVMDEVEDRSAPFVMTSWHEDESLDEVVDFFAALTKFDDWLPEAFVAVVVGGPADLEAAVRAALARRFGEG